MYKHSNLLPLLLAPTNGESGVGFLLRMASANGITMQKLRQLAGMSKSETFTAKHESRLLSLIGLAGLGAPQLLPQRTTGRGLICYGHRFRQGVMLRFRRPQFCPACVREARICAAHWDLSLSIVCLRHACLLQDFCPTCRAAVRWDRPSVEWGHCKHFLGGPAISNGISQDLFAIQKITEDLLNHQTPNFSPIGLIYPWLSLDAWCSFMWALGLIEVPGSPPRRTVITRVPSSLDARNFVARAVERLNACKATGRGIADLESVVAEAPLLGIILDPSNECDRAVGLSLYESIFGGRQLAALVRQHRELSQMHLF
ncbi:TniQ family protein [Paracidovorax avenae]|uniref:TniQ family protein n=1 Tax=Paracidovorax avenae TaxID=80867 RepID=UPI0022797F61|nr:TniQ family protein [Paracidovorax avenae]